MKKNNDFQEEFKEKLNNLFKKKYGEKPLIAFYDEFTDFVFSKVQKDDKEFYDKESYEKDIGNRAKQWMYGNNMPKNRTLVLLANFFHVSVDYLLGNTDVPEDYSEKHIHEYTGLDYEAIRQLHNWMDKKEIYHTQKNQSLAALNMILSYRYNQVNNDKDGWGSDVLHFIGNYLMSENAVRDIGYAGFETDIGKSITAPLPLEAGDVVIKNNGIDKLEVKSPVVCSNFTTDNKKIGLYENKNPGNKYIDSISELFKTASLNRIGKVLDNIIKNKPKKNAGV